MSYFPFNPHTLGLSMRTEPAQNPPKLLLILIKRTGRVGSRVQKMNKFEYTQFPTVGCSSWFYNSSVPPTDRLIDPLAY